MNTTGDIHCEETEVHAKALEKARNRLPDEIELSDLAEFFRIFGDSTRIRILSALYECELCVCDLAELWGEFFGGVPSIGHPAGQQAGKIPAGR